MKKLLILIAAAMSVVGCAKKDALKDYPMFWTWLNYDAPRFDSLCGVMVDTGLDGVILNARSADEYRAAVPVAKKHGLAVYAWTWTMNPEQDAAAIVRDHRDWLDVNRLGVSLADSAAYVDYYRFMTPALPEVHEYVLNKVRPLLEIDGLDGISIDYHRMVDVILPEGLWSKYGIVQDREYPRWDYGYHPAMIEKFRAAHGYDPRELEDPSTDSLWLQFRCDQISEVANEIAELVHSRGKVMAASPFPTPEMSRRMVRQDWGTWKLDLAFPMIYHNFYTGSVDFVAECTRANVVQKNPMTTLYAGLWAMDSDEMFASMDAAFDNGARGVAIFTIDALRSPDIRARFRTYADAKKKLKIEN